MIAFSLLFCLTVTRKKKEKNSKLIAGVTATNFKFFIYCVFSQLMYARDYSYKPDMIWQSFTAEKVPSLAGKPKIFFIQASDSKIKLYS